MKKFVLPKFIFNIFHPQMKIAGLEIVETDIRYAVLDENNVFFKSVRLSPGIVAEGMVKDGVALRKALATLHNEITRIKKKQLAVILSIPDSNVYTQVFSLPVEATSNLEEAVRLNLEMNSPIDISKSYMGWQILGESESLGGQIEILGAFASKEVVDAYVAALRDEYFPAATVEFSGLATSRIIGGLESKPVIVLRLTSGGFNFSLVKNSQLYFNHFTAWPVMPLISLKDFKEILIRETQRVINFAASRFRSSVNNLVVMVPSDPLEDKIADILQENFILEINELKEFIAPSVSRLDISRLDADSLPVLGTALRGASRKEDALLSVSGVSSKDIFFQEEVMNFIKFWRNIIFASAAAILLVFAGAEFFISNLSVSLEKKLAQADLVSPDEPEFVKLREEAKKFNEKIDLVVAAQEQSLDWTRYVERIKEAAGENISIKRLLMQSLNTPVILSGYARSQQDILNFKAALTEARGFYEVDLPLSAITPSGAGLIEFNISFKIKF